MIGLWISAALASLAFFIVPALLISTGMLAEDHDAERKFWRGFWVLTLVIVPAFVTLF